MHTFYIIFSPSRDKYYIGHTSDSIMERLRKHNTNHKGFTGSVGDWSVIYTETYHFKTKALSREREVKNWKSRKLLEKLIGSAHPNL